MKDIYIYFKGNQIWELNQRQIIGTLPNAKQKTVYQYMHALKKEHNIKLAIIGFNQPLRNTIYSLFPQASIMINPIDVMEMINYHIKNKSVEIEDRVIIGANIDIEQEVAIGLEENIVIDQARLICDGIYKSKTKNEAINYYIEWQGLIPLKNKSLHHIIRKIDFYFDEVFNYFDFNQVFPSEICFCKLS